MSILLSVGDASERLNVSTKTVRILIREKKLKAYRLGTGSRTILRISPKALEDYLAANAVGSGASSDG